MYESELEKVNKKSQQIKLFQEKVQDILKRMLLNGEARTTDEELVNWLKDYGFNVERDSYDRDYSHGRSEREWFYQVSFGFEDDLGMKLKETTEFAQILCRQDEGYLQTHKEEKVRKYVKNIESNRY